MSKANIHPLFVEIFSSFAEAPALADHINREALAQAIAESERRNERATCPNCASAESVNLQCANHVVIEREPRHRTGCICADCSGAELTANND